LDFSKVSARFNLERVREDLQRLEITSLPTLLSLQIATDATARKMAGRGRLNEDYYPILEYEAPKAFFLGSVANLIRSHDERETPSEGNALYLMHYLRERQQPLSREELKNVTAFHRTYGSRKILNGAVHDWVQRFPEDREALWALAQAQKADGQLESAMATLKLLLNDEPNHPQYLMLAADLELSLYQLQRSYLTPASSKPTLALLLRLLEVEVGNPAQVYRKIAQVYAVDGDFVSSLKSIEQAAESASRGEKNSVTPDVLWVEAAQMAVAIDEFGKARGYLLKSPCPEPAECICQPTLERATHDR
jgi:tetratricopeptide (TPR) repeat protein